MTYEDPQAVKGLASALDVRKQNTGGVGRCSVFCYLKPCLESKLQAAALTETSHSVFQPRASTEYFEIGIWEQVCAQ